MARKGLWRAMTDAWGYVSAWTNNGDGSYSWDHDSALVNADCVSDKVRENEKFHNNINITEILSIV